MFTGLIQSVGSVVASRRIGKGLVLSISSDFSDLQLGESIAIDGGCFTVTHMDGSTFTVDVAPESVARTTLGQAKTGQKMNLERALRLSDRLGGHIVTGHVDCTGTLDKVVDRGEFVELEFLVPDRYSRYLVEKGSVAVDGISLTIAACKGGRFSVSVIPLTLSSTTLEKKRVSDRVNVETDILGKYVEKLMTPGGRDDTGSDEGLLRLLSRQGFVK